MGEVLDAVRAAFGPDAVILESRKLPLGERGTPDQAILVRAALERDTPAAAEPSTAEPRDFQMRAPIRDEVQGLREEVHGLRGLLFQALDMNERQPTGWPAAAAKLYANLRAQGMTAPEARQWSATVAAAVPKGKGETRSLVRSVIQRLLQRDVGFTGGIAPQANRQQRIALIGATGVGKTTTLAKLAAAAALREGRRVGVLTVDTFRIAAVEQLRIYCGIMGLPMEVVRAPAEVAPALMRLADADLVLIDTAGRSPRNEEQMAELDALLGAIPEIDAHLVLPATHTVRTLTDVLRRFERYGPSRIIVSKLDESEGLGGVVEVARRAKLPLSYATTGQGVPDDIDVLTARFVAGELADSNKDRVTPSRNNPWKGEAVTAAKVSSEAVG